MISSATMKVGKKTLKMKLSTRALVRLEREHDGLSFDEILDQLLTGKGGVSLLASVLAAGLSDGKGVEPEEAYDMIDSAGGFHKMMPLVSDAIGCAFPHLKPASEGATAGEEAGEEAEPGKIQPPAKA